MRASGTNRRLSGWICSSCSRRSQASQTQRRTKSTSPPKARLPDAPTRTRFAPSPTGNLHLGSIRTALFNYLLARRTGGQFLLRIEDTDRKRTIPGAEERLYKDLRWAGLQWDEGPVIGGPYGPYRQSERVPLYQEYAKSLVDSGKAYRCYCSAERIKAIHEARHAEGLPLGYDRKCADIPIGESGSRAQKGEAHVVRLLAPKQYLTYNDLIYGKSGHGIKKIVSDDTVWDDHILVKSDGFPTYHFANVIDDHLMKITHVIRGSEWMSSTPLHVALYEAFSWEPPAFAHVPLLVDSSGQKLSKRNFDTDIAAFKNQGIFPEALTNFTALMGWSHRGRDDVMDLQQLSEVFDLKITKGNTIVSPSKLTFLQQRHARRRIEAGGEPFEQMIRDIASALLERYGAGRVANLVGTRKLRDIVACIAREAAREQYPGPTAIAENTRIFFDDLPPLPPPPDISAQPLIPVLAASLLLTPDEHWNAELHLANVNALHLSTEPHSGSEGSMKAQNGKIKGQLWHWLRWALVGAADGPGVPGLMEILGRDICMQRIQAGVALTRNQKMQRTKPNIEVMQAAGMKRDPEQTQPHISAGKVARAG